MKFKEARSCYPYSSPPVLPFNLIERFFTIRQIQTEKGDIMQLKQGDLFWGMDSNFVKQVMDETEKKNYDEGAVLFDSGDAADHFYILIKGRIKLTIGGEGPIVYIAKDPGQVIGWSTLLGRDLYSAKATCVEPTKMVKVGKDSFLEGLAKVPESEALFFKRVAGMLGDRLVSVYPSVA